MIHKGMMKFRMNERRIRIHYKNGPILSKKNYGLIEKAIEVVHEDDVWFSIVLGGLP
jgi:hypothetical protein